MTLTARLCCLLRSRSFLPLLLAANGMSISLSAAEHSAVEVVVKPGAATSGRSSPIEPKCFEVAIGKVEQGETVPFEMEFTNTSDTPLKFVGGNEWCSRSGCITLVGQPLREIAPRSTYRVKARYKALKPNPQRLEHKVELQGEFYLGGERTFAVPYRVIAVVRSKS